MASIESSTIHEDHIRKAAIGMGSFEAVVRSTYWKYRYNLKTSGFSDKQAKRLIFLKWLLMNKREKLF